MKTYTIHNVPETAMAYPYIVACFINGRWEYEGAYEHIIPASSAAARKGGSYFRTANEIERA